MVEVNDWRGWTGFRCAWNEQSHPEIALRFRIKNYIFNLTYFRYRPKKYRTQGVNGIGKCPVDAPFVFDWPSVQHDKQLYEFYPSVRKPWIQVKYV